MFALITAPNVSDTLTNIGLWSEPIFTEMIVVGVIFIGIAIGFGALAKVVRAFIGGAKILLGSKSGGRRRR